MLHVCFKFVAFKFCCLEPGRDRDRDRDRDRYPEMLIGFGLNSVLNFETKIVQVHSGVKQVKFS